MVPNKPHPLSALPAWKLEDAEAQFGEVVRRAREIGPQRVTMDGQDAIIVLSAATVSLAALFGEGPFAALDEFEPLRELSPVRDLPSET